MAIPAIPAQGAPWLTYAQALDDEIRTGRLSDAELGATYARKGLVGGTAKTASYTIAAADIGSVIEVDSASSAIVSVPLDADASIPVGSWFDVLRLGAGRLVTRPVLQNLATNPSLETDAVGYTLRNGTIARLAGAAIRGGFGLRATSTATSQFWGMFYTNNLTLAEMDLKVGDVVSVRVDQVVPAGVTSRVGIRFTVGSPTGATVTQTFGPYIGTGTAKVENVAVPAGATHILIVTDPAAPGSTASGQNIDFDGVMIVRGATAPANYADGASAGYVWAGTAHASQTMGPAVFGGAELPRYGRERVRKVAASTWIREGTVADNALVDGDVLLADRDNGQPGMAAPSPQGGSQAGAALVANTAYLARFVPSRDIVVTMLAFRVSTASGTDDPVDVGIYDAALTRLVSSGATTGKLNSTGTKTATVTATRLNAGSVYYAALAANSTASVTQVTVLGDAFGTTSPKAECLTKTASYPLPSTLTGPTVADTVPRLFVRES